MLEMLDLDVRYVNEWSFWEDVRILLATPSALLRGDGAR
jgi:lipopolysaccharide/colanic/teichoic acid biosynthesis glycosyltransferase